MMNKKSFLIVFILTGYLLNAQVKDISFTLSPAAEYTFWDDKAGLEDNLLVGGKLGFGFGEFIELRALYMQSLDLKTDFSEFGIDGYDATLFNAQNIDLTRWGGEFKANLGTKGVKPYLTLGAGVQNIDVENTGDFEQVYGSVGLGVKFNIAKRLVLALEAKNTTYKFNSGMNLLTDADKSAFGVADADFETERMSNWSAQGSLQFYLGGRKPGELSDLDRAYLQQFKGGFKGLQWVIEPSLAYTNFDDASLLKDTYWLGGYAGLDLNEFIGVRAFYFQATQNEKISTDFDKMAMYGGEFRARLNDGNGVTPFLILGGGYLNPSSNYLSVPDEAGLTTQVEGGEFATGGLGLNIPLGKHLLITGGARAMITSGENVTDITNTDDILTHIFYNAGLKFTLGKKSEAPNSVYQDNLDSELSVQEQRNNEKLANLKGDYETQINTLEGELKQAYEARDVEKAVEILEEKKQVVKALEEVKEVEKAVEVKQASVVKTQTVVGDSKLIQMTPSEFESLIARILQDVDKETLPTTRIQNGTIQTQNNTIQEQRIQQLNDRVEMLEKLLLQLNTKQGASLNNDGVIDKSNQQVGDYNTKIINTLDDLNKKIDDNSNQIQSDKNRSQTVVVTPSKNNKGERVISVENAEYDVKNASNLKSIDEIDDVEVEKDSVKMLTYKHSSAILGFNYGGASTANLGLRLHYDIKNTKLQFMPEAYVGFGEANAWALSGNAIYPIEIKSEKFKPYAGAGLGFGNFVDGTEGFYNVILGTKLPFLNENLYVDYTMRNTFDYNQIAVGYNFKF